MPNLDKFEIAILKVLQEDARATNVEIAERVNLSPSPCLRRIRNLEKSGVLRGYRADIDRKEVGLGLTVFVEIKVGTTPGKMPWRSRRRCLRCRRSSLVS